MKNTAKRIVFIGSGNVATHLAQALDVKNKVIAVYSREQSHAERLCKKLKKAKAYSDPSLLPTDADFYIVAVNDDAIEEVAKSVQVSSGIWVHTSGSVPAWIFKDIKDNYGVFYPLQTFNRDKEVDVNEVPIFVEGSSEAVSLSLYKLAESISEKVDYADSVGRKRIHLAAVFGCNFVNRLWGIASHILLVGGYDLSVLEPLMRASLENALKYGPDNVQTGPAMRGDTNVTKKQLNLLPMDESRKIYRAINESIIRKHRVK